jgi:hypothetical protein
MILKLNNPHSHGVHFPTCEFILHVILYHFNRIFNSNELKNQAIFSTEKSVNMMILIPYWLFSEQVNSTYLKLGQYIVTSLEIMTFICMFKVKASTSGSICEIVFLYKI